MLPAFRKKHKKNLYKETLACLQPTWIVLQDSPRLFILCLSIILSIYIYSGEIENKEGKIQNLN